MNDGDDLQAAAESLRRLFVSEHPDAETTLVAYVDGALDAEEREWVEEHLAGCAVCRDEVANLREAARPDAPRLAHGARWSLLAAAIAGLALLVFVVFVVVRPQRPAVVASHVSGHSEWDALERAARADGHMAPPAAWKGVQAAPDVVRGTQGVSTGGAFVPSGAVVESQQPRFSWPPIPGARYVVRVSSGSVEVAHSSLLPEPGWTPSAPLPRGATYLWQVEVHAGGRIEVETAPPQPVLLFAVADARSARDLAAARRAHPDDHFLLGVLYARAGVREEARAEFTVWLAAHPNDDAARRLLHDLDHW